MESVVDIQKQFELKYCIIPDGQERDLGMHFMIQCVWEYFWPLNWFCVMQQIVLTQDGRYSTSWWRYNRQIIH